MGQSTISFRVDENLKRNFDKLCTEFGVSNSAALTIFMKAVVREKRIPFEIKADYKSDKKAMAMGTMDQLRNYAHQKGLTNMTLEEINEEIRLVRSREGL